MVRQRRRTPCSERSSEQDAAVVSLLMEGCSMDHAALPENGVTTLCPGLPRTNILGHNAGVDEKAVLRPGFQGQAWLTTTIEQRARTLRRWKFPLVPSKGINQREQHSLGMSIDWRVGWRTSSISLIPT